jgi:hypothetical protein
MSVVDRDNWDTAILHRHVLLLCKDGAVGVEVVFLEKFFTADHEVEQGITHAEERASRHDDGSG